MVSSRFRQCRCFSSESRKGGNTPLLRLLVQQGDSFPQKIFLKSMLLRLVNRLTAPNRQLWSLQQPPFQAVLPMPLFTRTHYLQQSLSSFTYFFSCLNRSAKPILEAWTEAMYLSAALNRKGWSSLMSWLMTASPSSISFPSVLGFRTQFYLWLSLRMTCVPTSWFRAPSRLTLLYSRGNLILSTILSLKNETLVRDSIEGSNLSCTYSSKPSPQRQAMLIWVTSSWERTGSGWGVNLLFCRIFTAVCWQVMLRGMTYGQTMELQLKWGSQLQLLWKNLSRSEEQLLGKRSLSLHPLYCAFSRSAYYSCHCYSSPESAPQGALSSCIDSI